MTVSESSLHSKPSVLPEGFVYLEERVPGIQVELRYAGTNNFLGKRVDGYMEARAILTGLATRAVAKVQSELEEIGLGLKVFDSYRPQRAVDQFVRWANDPFDLSTRSEYYPNMEKDQLIPCGYLAEFSSHSRGSTLDLTIVSLNPEFPRELDMGTSFDYFGPESWPQSNAVTSEQHARRMLLQSRMGTQGFLPLKEEWWHFTLADEPFPDTYFDFPVE